MFTFVEVTLPLDTIVSVGLLSIDGIHTLSIIVQNTCDDPDPGSEKLVEKLVLSAHRVGTCNWKQMALLISLDEIIVRSTCGFFTSHGRIAS